MSCPYSGRGALAPLAMPVHGKVRVTEIETWRTRARRMIDEKFSEQKTQYHNNEILRLQKARGAQKLQHPAPMPGMVDAMDGPGIEREAWQNVLGGSSSAGFASVPCASS